MHRIHCQVSLGTGWALAQAWLRSGTQEDKVACFSGHCWYLCSVILSLHTDHTNGWQAVNSGVNSSYLLNLRENTWPLSLVVKQTKLIPCWKCSCDWLLGFGWFRNGPQMSPFWSPVLCTCSLTLFCYVGYLFCLGNTIHGEMAVTHQRSTGAPMSKNISGTPSWLPTFYSLGQRPRAILSLKLKTVLMWSAWCLLSGVVLSVCMSLSLGPPKNYETNQTSLIFILWKVHCYSYKSMFVLLMTSGVIASLFIEISICFLAKRPSKNSHLKVVFSCEIAYAVGFTPCSSIHIYSWKTFCAYMDFLPSKMWNSDAQKDKKQVLQFS